MGDLSTSDDVRAFLIECMADAIWREGLSYLPLGEAAKLAAAAYDAMPEEMTARMAEPLPEGADARSDG